VDNLAARVATTHAASYRIHMNGIKQPSWHPGAIQLFDAEGRRLYLTEDERRAFVVSGREGLA
jgi:hypothetical protein